MVARAHDQTLPLEVKTVNRSIYADCVSDYTKALDQCRTVADLQALVHDYGDVAVDAVPVVDAMTAKDWSAFKRGLRRERQGTFAGDAWVERFGPILMPFPMLKIAAVAEEFKVPFGVAWMRLREVRPDLLKLPE